MEIRVYVVNINHLQEGNAQDDAREYTNDEFITEAERQGSVYSLHGFEVALNYEELFLDESYIRII